MDRKKILFVIGSPNQTSQMHKISLELPDYDCYFTQIFSNSPLSNILKRTGVLDTTILAGEFKRKGDAYIEANGLKNDYAIQVYRNRYDLVIICTDLIVPKELRKMKTIFVQEGMTDPITNWAKLIHALKLPGFMAMNTSLNGSGNICDIYCVASNGYKQQFIGMGTEEKRILVTGIPNYDDIPSFLNNDFPHHGYVMVATSDIRETFRKEDRPQFLRDCVRIADGRQLLFKLHPNEEKDRAISEIKQYCPADTLIFTEGSTEHMIANSVELITQYSTVVYIGIALGLKVHSYFDVEHLKTLMPDQNEGSSSGFIAEIARKYIEFDGGRDAFLSSPIFAEIKNRHD